MPATLRHGGDRELLQALHSTRDQPTFPALEIAERRSTFATPCCLQLTANLVQTHTQGESQNKENNTLQAGNPPRILEFNDCFS